MEDITDEIKDLQQSITSNFDGKNKDIKIEGSTNETKKDEFSQSYGEKIKVWQDALIHTIRMHKFSYSYYDLEC